MSAFYEAVYRLVRRIPRGRVMTYGQVATVLGCPRAARAVGYALRASKGEGALPWQRVINRRGGISTRTASEGEWAQQALLEAEGVVFNADGECDLSVYRWEPPDEEDYSFETRLDFPFL